MRRIIIVELGSHDIFDPFEVFEFYYLKNKKKQTTTRFVIISHQFTNNFDKQLVLIAQASFTWTFPPT